MGAARGLRAVRIISLKANPDRQGVDIFSGAGRASLAMDGSISTRDPQRAADLHARDARIDEEMLGLLERQEALTAA